MNIKNILITGFLICITFFAFSQSESISEGDVDLNIQKWFYNQYPKSSEAVWSKLHSASAKERFQVTFIFEGSHITAVYNNEGERVSEQREVLSPHISLVNYVADNYDKPKIKEVVLKTDFTSNEQTYIVDLKSKSKGFETLRFDESFNPIPQDFISSSN